jgi:hypothetical protein
MEKNAKATKKSKVNQVQTERRQLEVGELELVYGGLRVIEDPGTKG